MPDLNDSSSNPLLLKVSTIKLVAKNVDGGFLKVPIFIDV
jgi:hypothetical protein